MYFVNSVRDLFHEKLAIDKIVSVARVIEACPYHTFEVFTKRAVRMATMLNSELRLVASKRHILWGASVENRNAISRLDEQRSTPRGLRFVSFEPLSSAVKAVRRLDH